MKKVKKILSLALGLSLAVSCTLSTITSSAINISDDPFDMDSQAGAICFLSSKSVTITLDKTEYAYNGTQIKPKVVSVHYKASTYDLDLALGDDYTVEYGENVELGKGTVTIVGSQNTNIETSGRNCYVGKVTVEFDIVNDIEKPVAPEFRSISLTLTGIIGANVFYTIPDAYLTEDYIVETEFTGAGVSKVTVPVDVNKVVSTAGEKQYVFTLPVKSCNMQKEYFARLYVRKAADRSTVATTGRDTVVVSNYVNAFAASSDAIKSAFGKAMQTYGYYSQKMFNDLEELPNITLLNLSDVTTSTVADYESDIRPYRGTIKGEISQTSLYLDSGTGIRAYLSNLSADVDTSNLYMQYKVGTVTNRVKVQRDDAGKYYGEVPDVPADKLSAMYSIAFYEGETQITDTTNYGAYSYIYATLNSTSVSEDLKNLVRALYKYSVATEDLLAIS